MVSLLPFRITLFKSQTDHGIPKRKSVTWFPFVQTHKTLLSSTQLTQSDFVSPLSIVPLTKLFIPHFPHASKCRHVTMSGPPMTLFWGSVHPQDLMGQHPCVHLTPLQSLIQGQSTGTSQTVVTCVARYLS